MTLKPLYRSSDLTPAYCLRHTWCGWATSGDLRMLDDDQWIALNNAWQKDHLNLLERSIEGDEILLTFGTSPVVSPTFLAKRAKGRLDHAFRAIDANAVDFSRKIAVRAVGENTTDDVRAYIASQIQNEEFLDPRFAEFLEQFTIVDSSDDLSVPSESRSGRYWYNLHLVLVTDGRTRVVDEASLKAMRRDGSFRDCGAGRGYRIAAISVMPDHVHVALRGMIEHLAGGCRAILRE